MSRIGKKLINVPDGVQISIENKKITVKGPKGELSLDIPNAITIVQEDSSLQVVPDDDTVKQQRMKWGLIRALVANMVIGVTEGFEKKLEINGVGYKAAMQGKKIVMQLGYSHPVEIDIPEGIEVVVEKNMVSIKGIDKYLVGEIAATIRSKRKPEPYKGKGIKYIDEVIRRKAGKKAAGK
ncbi:50S ribosomal protein L6 [bacterium]|nr:MAG: 50S ribosomal protein L6 [bacterium]